MNPGNQSLLAGAAQAAITPPLGAAMAGWRIRAAGDNRARYVHDDLYVKALVLRSGDRAWALIVADLAVIDPLATDLIRSGVAERTGLAKDAILVCATHCHSAPVVCPIALACDRQALEKRAVQSDGTITGDWNNRLKVASAVSYADGMDWEWRKRWVATAIQTAHSAWESLRPAEIAYGESVVEGVASSRRVRLDDGTWADPRSGGIGGRRVVSRTEIDPTVRALVLREFPSRRPLAAVMNYGSHPWIFSGSGISAELAGAACHRVAAQWTAPGASPPAVIYTAGPEGDATPIWNVDVEKLWKTRNGETTEQSLRRREQAFGEELERLGGRLADGVMRAIETAGEWAATPLISSARQEFSLPLKAGYRTPPEVLLADWQKPATESNHLTEIQFLQVGEAAILGLPGEPFTSLGHAIRQQVPFRHFLIAALANDGGEVNYTADRASCELGGYEIESFPLASGAGEILVERAVELARKFNPASQQSPATTKP